MSLQPCIVALAVHFLDTVTRTSQTPRTPAPASTLRRKILLHIPIYDACTLSSAMKHLYS
jgi:hypothetical protein